MKIKFIEPTRYLKNGKLMKSDKLFYPALTFPLLASLTPPENEIVVQNELFENIDFEEKTDLVGITAITNNVFRAYEIADTYRRKKIPVVMGGFHVTAMPKEALEHCDAVFIGEAEETWPQFLKDFKKGSFNKLYSPKKISPSLSNLPVPDLSIMNPNHYFMYKKKWWMPKLISPVIPVQTARGCPNRCEFCDIISFHKGNYRTRPIEDVINEINTQHAKFVCFVDDNIFAIPERAKKLMKELIPLKIKWISQGTINAAEDEELLSLAKKSGCKGLLVGLETISPEGLKFLKKNRINKFTNYEENLKAFKKYNIDVNASMVFGSDGDDPEVFENTYKFLIKNKVPYAGLQPLRPSPGTPFYYKLKNQGRLKEEKWWLNRKSVADVFDLKFTGTKVDSDFEKVFFKYYKKFYSFNSIFKRFLFPPGKGFLIKTIATLLLRRKISDQAFISER